MAESIHAATEAAVLAANAAFYRAFSDGDYAAMNELWAERAPVACLHPTSQALMGRSLVLRAWRQILSGSTHFELRCDQPVVHVFGDAAVVTCYEAGGDEPAHLAATNVFVLEEGRWRMVHHHAGPISRPPPLPPPALSMN
jgi:ketosteroid isomerase-like protein